MPRRAGRSLASGQGSRLRAVALDGFDTPQMVNPRDKAA